MKLTDLDAMRNAVVELALDLDGKLRVDYSGRSMYGACCYGIVTDDPDDCVEEAASRGLRGARRDSMGLKYIVYWPHIAGIVLRDDSTAVEQSPDKEKP